MRHILYRTLVLFLTATLLTGCSGRPATSTPNNGADADTSMPQSPAQTPDDGVERKVKTGFSMRTSVTGSQDATNENGGVAQAQVTLVAVTVDDEGIIDSCVIDQVQSNLGFDHAGQLTGDPTADVLSKNELGADYGMASASSIGAEWYQQAQALAGYAVGKTVEQLKGIAVNEMGAPQDADLAATVTISISDFVAGIEDAANHAQHRGATVGDRLALSTTANMLSSKSAAADAEGLAQTEVNAAAVTFDGQTITSCYLDAVQAKVNFTQQGSITTDLSAQQLSKNQLGDDYGMKAASSIGAEWYQQAEGFCQYVTGKTVGEAAAIAVDESTKPVGADLVSSVTISIGDFMALIQKAAA